MSFAAALGRPLDSGGARPGFKSIVGRRGGAGTGASFSRQVGDGKVLGHAALQGVLVHTREMREAVGILQGRLQASRQEVDPLRAEIDRASEEALIDALTGLANRRALDARLAAALAYAGTGDCLLLADIDHFKKINDSCGHLFGDQVLRAVAQALKGCVGGDQLVARVGSEEFAVLLPRAVTRQGMVVAEKIRTTVAASRIRRKESEEPIGQVTASLGVAERVADEDASSWYDRADPALYPSKQRGRNRVWLGRRRQHVRDGLSGQAPPCARCAAAHRKHLV